jgi:hypothetical protein
MIVCEEIKMKPYLKMIIIGSLVLAILVLVGISIWKENQIASVPFESPEYSKPSGPKINGPLPNGEKVPLEFARAKLPYSIQLPNGFEVDEVWVSTEEINSTKQSLAVRFKADLLLIIHFTEKPPDWDRIIAGTPQLKKIYVNGNTGIGTAPGFTHNNGIDYPYPGSVEWWVDNLNITLYSNTLSLEDLLKIAETVH